MLFVPFMLFMPLSGSRLFLLCEFCAFYAFCAYKKDLSESCLYTFCVLCTFYAFCAFIFFYVLLCTFCLFYAFCTVCAFCAFYVRVQFSRKKKV